jgi:hypothetical protein
VRRTSDQHVHSQSAQSAALRPWSDQCIVKTGVRVGLAAIALIGIAWRESAVAGVCRVPAAVLCEGCVERLAIRVGPGGSCRISFSPPMSPAQSGATKFVDISIETEAPRTTTHRASPPRLPAVRQSTPVRALPTCFVFTGRRFCE